MFSVETSLKVRVNILLGASLIAIGLLLACRSTAAPLQMTLKIAPDHPTMTKPMTSTLHITDDHGQPVNDATVNGALTMKLMDMGWLPRGLRPGLTSSRRCAAGSDRNSGCLFHHEIRFPVATQSLKASSTCVSYCPVPGSADARCCPA